MTEESSELEPAASAVPAELAVRERMQAAGVRPTRKRLMLGRLLFSSGDRHISADQLYLEALQNGARVSLATVYSVLRDFTEAGLVRAIPIGGRAVRYDTNPTRHSHFLKGAGRELVDVAGDGIRVEGVPEPPVGLRVSRIDVVVHLVAE